MSDEQKGALSVREAGRLGGLKTLAVHGIEHYVRIGKAGGEKIKDLVRRGREAAQEKLQP